MIDWRVSSAAVLGASLLLPGCEGDQAPDQAGASYGGKPASYWGKALLTPDPAGGRDPLLPRVNPAVRRELTGGGRKAVPVLLDLLKDGDTRVREAAGLCLVEIGPKAGPEPFVALLEAKVDSNFFRVRVRRRAVHVLGQVGPGDPLAVAALVDALRYEEVVSSEVPDVLGKFGPAAIPPLQDALRDRYFHVQEGATRALVKIGPAAVPAIADALGDRAFNVRYGVVCALGHMGPDAAVAVGPLIGALKDRRDAHFVRSMAARALGEVGPAARPAVPRLVELLQDDDEYVRRHAAQALRKIDPGAAKAGRPG